MCSRSCTSEFLLIDDALNKHSFKGTVEPIKSKTLTAKICSNFANLQCARAIATISDISQCSQACQS